MGLFRYVQITVQIIMRAIARFWWGKSLTVRGIENVPLDKRPIIFASSHTSERDGELIRCALPALYKNAPLYYVSMTKEYYPKERFGLRSYLYGGIFFKMMAAYPVYKGLKNYMRALYHHEKILRAGGAVCIFPEGKIIKDVSDRPAHGGVGYLVSTTGATVVPVRVKGLGIFAGETSGGVEVCFGKPITKDELFSMNNPQVADMQRASQIIMQHVYAL